MQPAIHCIYTGQDSNLSENADLFVQAVWTVLTLPEPDDHTAEASQ
jgi:hypothetical protein